MALLRQAIARAVVVLVGTFVLCAGSACAAELRVGNTLPAVTLSDWGGQPLSLADLAGKVVIIDFWASWCQLCRPALPALDEMGREHAAAGLAVVAINIDRDVAAADRFLAERLPERSIVLARDPTASLLARFGANGMPALYVVDRSGVVRMIEAGYAPERLRDVEKLVATLLAR